MNAHCDIEYQPKKIDDTHFEINIKIKAPELVAAMVEREISEAVNRFAERAGGIGHREEEDTETGEKTISRIFSGHGNKTGNA